MGRPASSPRPPARWCSRGPQAPARRIRRRGRGPDRPESGVHRRRPPDNLARLATEHDPRDRGLRDMWEATVLTGRTIGEVIDVRWDCLGRYGGLPMFWHDQTKVGNYDAAIRIPERLYQRLAERQQKTMDA